MNSCGCGNARTAGSLSPAGPTYAETLPPKDWLATRAYSATGQVTLANMEALVSGAAAHGGGWSQIVIGKVCSQAQDPANYNTCTTSARLDRTGRPELLPGLDGQRPPVRARRPGRR